MKYLITLVGVVNLAKGTSKPEGKHIANASDCLETWDDSDNITAVNARKDLRHPANGGITTQHHHITVLRPAMNIRK